jgi:predicted nucleic acid-binding protein
MMVRGQTFLVVDASLWVARLVPQDVFHSAVRAWMDARLLEGTEFVAPALLLAETAGAISRRTGEAFLAAQAVEHLEHLPGLRLVEMDSVLIKEAAQLAAELGLRGSDSVYVAVASRLGIPLATLDADQRLRAGQRFVCITIP